MTAQSHDDLIQIIDVTFLQHNKQRMFKVGDRACARFLTNLTALVTRNNPVFHVRCLASRSGGDKNMRNASFCGRGYYPANLVTQARYEKIMMASILTFAYIKQILLYAFKNFIYR